MIIIGVNAFASTKESEEIQQSLVKQAKDEVVVIPPCCKLLAITDDDNMQVLYAEDGVIYKARQE